VDLWILKDLREERRQEKKAGVRRETNGGRGLDSVYRGENSRNVYYLSIYILVAFEWDCKRLKIRELEVPIETTGMQTVYLKSGKQKKGKLKTGIRNLRKEVR
jgi:hypothetical protein